MLIELGRINHGRYKYMRALSAFHIRQAVTGAAMARLIGDGRLVPSDVIRLRPSL